MRLRPQLPDVQFPKEGLLARALADLFAVLGLFLDKVSVLITLVIGLVVVVLISAVVGLIMLVL